MGKFAKFADDSKSSSNYVPVEKKRQNKKSESIDSLVSIKIHQSAKKELKEASFHTGKPQTQLMGELIKRFLPQLEQELLDETANSSGVQTTIFEFLD